MGKVDPTLERTQSAFEEACRLAGVTSPLGQLAVTAFEVRRTYPTYTEEAHKARQALQESMDLREQGHADD